MSYRAIVLQSGGSTAVINQSLAGVIDGVKKSKRYASLLGARHGILGVLGEDWIRLNSLSRAAIEGIKNSPSSALGSCRRKLVPNDCEQIVQTLKRNKIDHLFLIGGNDSAETGLFLQMVAAERLYPLQVIGVPKTIDNDLPGMDHAPGYGSVARFLAVAVQEASLDTRAMRHTDPVKIIETMGRNSGWIVAAASLGKRRPEDGPHLLYFPERPFEKKKFIADAKKVYKRFGFVVVVISETICDAKGKRIGAPKQIVKGDQFGHAYVEGAAETLCHLIESELRVRARFDKPGTIARMSMSYISKIDQREAHACGEHAVRLACQGKTNVMVSMKRVSDKPYRIVFADVPLSEVAGTEKKLPNDFINTAGNFVTAKFQKYALPLIGGPLPEYTFLA